MGTYVRRVLKANGYTVSVAENGLSALDHIEVDLPHLVLLDLVMPVMDGFDFAQELKKRGLRTKIPVLLHTTYPYAEELMELIGAIGCIPKPCTATVLLERIEGSLPRASLALTQKERSGEKSENTAHNTQKVTFSLSEKELPG